MWRRKAYRTAGCMLYRGGGGAGAGSCRGQKMLDRMQSRGDKRSCSAGDVPETMAMNSAEMEGCRRLPPRFCRGSSGVSEPGRRCWSPWPCCSPMHFWSHPIAFLLGPCAARRKPRLPARAPGSPFAPGSGAERGSYPTCCWRPCCCRCRCRWH